MLIIPVKHFQIVMWHVSDNQWLRNRQSVDFVIWRLFKRSTFHRPSHLLCHGFQRSVPHGQRGPQRTAHSIPGLHSFHRNSSVETLKGPLWCRLHALLGHGGELIIMDMLFDCGLFTPVKDSCGNYVQLSGVPLSELKPVSPTRGSLPVDRTNSITSKNRQVLANETRSASAICFVRSRMFYAKPALNARGGVRFGLRHIRMYEPQN